MFCDTMIIQAAVPYQKQPSCPERGYSMLAEKKLVRKQFRDMRNGMAPGQVKELSERICANVTASPQFLEAERIFAYYPIGNEADVRKIVREAWRQGKQVAFPGVSGEDMVFFRVSDFLKLHPGTFGVMEPEETYPVEWESGLMLVPGVAFDRRGGRMGFGKGYYDRYLADHPGCTRMGIAYELQVGDQIPVEETDMPLHYLATEQGITDMRKQR